MDIFLTGGTGVVGRPLIPLLVGAGHRVRVVARSTARAELVRRLGGEPVHLPRYDAASLAGVMRGAEVVVDLTTAVPSLLRAGRRRAFRQHDWLRDQGTAAVVAAAEATGVRRVVRDSVAFAHADGGERWIDEDWPMQPGPHLASSAAAERYVSGFCGDGVVLRFCLLYGPASSHTRTAVRTARHLRVTPVVGAADAYASSLHHDDAASAALHGLTVPVGRYDVGDDEPLRRRELVAAEAAALGLRRLRQVPQWMARGATAEPLTRGHRINAERFRAASGWAPRWRSAAEGWAATVEAL